MITPTQDLRYALRMLAKSPGFTAVAVLLTALGVGASAAIFSVVNGVLLRPLPFKESQQIALIWMDNRRAGIRRDAVSYPNFEDWRDQNTVFQQMAIFSLTRAHLIGVDEPEEVGGALASASLFPLLGVNAIHGRTFLPKDDEPDSERVAILSYGLWQRRFGADPSVVGRTINLNYGTRTVIGVMPPGFQFPEKVDVWAPFPVRGNESLKNRTMTVFQVVGRLRAGVPLEQAQAEMDTIASRLEQQYPKENQGYGAYVVPLREEMVGHLRASLLMLLGAVGFVLLIACANVANLLLARSATRQQEIAIRSALGAGRLRIIRQLLTESVLLAGLGGILGSILAVWGTRLLVAMAPADLLRLDQIAIDGRLLGFALTVSLLTGLIFGIAPAWHASKPRLSEALKEGGRTAMGSRSGQRLRQLLVVIEIALAVVLLIGAGLMIKSFMRLQEVNPGFNPERLLTFRLELPGRKYNKRDQRIAFFQQLLARIEALPGVKSVGATTNILFGKLIGTETFRIEGRPSTDDKPNEVPATAVTPNYFSLMGIPVIKGRSFTEYDHQQAPPVVIINQTMARQYWPDEDPLGKRIKLIALDDDKPWRTIVGVVGDVRSSGLDAEIKPNLFLSYSQPPSYATSGGIIVVRTASDPLSLANALRQAVWALDKDLPVVDMKTMQQMLAEKVSPRRFTMLLLSLFAATALILASVGVYGVMAYTVTQRTHEIGIRIALGAQALDVIKLVVGQGLVLTGIGIAIGLAAALVLTRLMSSLLYEVNATDPAIFAAIALLLAGVALVAGYIPARRATKIEPVVALRYE